MIRRVVSTSDKPVWGVTARGLALVGFEYAMTFVAIAFAILAFIGVHDERVNGIRTTCREANVRHREAIPKLGGLITNGPPARTRPEREMRASQRRALFLLAHGFPAPPKGLGAKEETIRSAYNQISGFIDLFAPHYDCSARVRLLTR